MKKILIISLIIGLGLNYSCNDIIETDPESEITVNSFWQTEDDALGGLYGMYNQFRTFARTDLILLGAARSELMGHGLQNADTRIKYFENTLTESNADLDWQQMYRIVDYANLVIQNVPDIEFSNAEDKDNIIAQGYTMRAYIYFVMAKTWGDLPLVTEPIESYDAESTFKERTAASQIFEFIKSDIDQANNLFSDNSYNASRSIWSKPALNMLKAEVYLWTGKRMSGGDSDINTALTALNDAANSDVGLLDNYGDIFSYSNKGNNEVILAVNFKDLEASNNYFGDMYINANDVSSTIDEQTREAIGEAGGYNWWAPSAIIRDQFNDDDQRKDASFLEINYTKDDGTSAFLTSIVLKGRGFVDGGERKFLDDIIIYRYADLLLMKAEAKNALNQDPTDEINEVRQRAYGDNYADNVFVSGTQEENDEAILQERLFELAFEGKRWWDLVRFDKAFELVPSLEGRGSDTYLLLWPVTLQTISLNSKITQTQGYN